MTFVYDNGDVNVGLATLFCVGFIVTFFILVSIFSRIGKKEEEELEEYYDDNIAQQPKQKKKVVNKTKAPSVKSPKVNKKATPNPKQTVLSTASTPNTNNNIVTATTVATPQKVTKKTSKSKKTTQPVSTPVVQTPVVQTKVKAKKTSPNTKPKTKPVKKKEVTQPTTIKPTVVDNAQPETVQPETAQPETAQPVIAPVQTTTVVAPPQPTKLKQSSVKVIKLGNVQVKESIPLNEAEKKMLSSVIASADRGHIIQLMNGAKIMDFPIDSTTQLNHIEKQIQRFGDNTGSYIVYVIWESNLKYRANLSQKLRYNPNVRYK